MKTWRPGAARASHLTIQRQLGALTGAARATHLTIQRQLGALTGAARATHLTIQRQLGALTGAARATHLTIQRQLGALTGAAPSTLQVWRAEDPYRWYVVGLPSLGPHLLVFFLQYLLLGLQFCSPSQRFAMLYPILFYCSTFPLTLRKLFTTLCNKILLWSPPIRCNIPSHTLL